MQLLITVPDSSGPLIVLLATSQSDPCMCGKLGSAHEGPSTMIVPL